MTRQQFMAELSNLLGFMSYEDRERTIERYNRMFDKAEDEEEFMSRLGTPTKLAIRLAGEYVPTTPEEREEDEREREAFERELREIRGIVSDGGAPGDAETDAPDPSGSPEEQPPPPEETRPEGPEPGRAGKRAGPRRVRPAALAAYIFLSLLIGLPVAVVLVMVGAAFASAGVGAGAAAVFAALELIGFLTLFSDIALAAGAALIVCAVALVLVWFGLWLAVSLARLWIGGVVVRLGARLCFVKEAEAE